MRDQFRALARDATFIPFVYDYCDMWCERCPLTARCLVFAVDPQKPGGTSAADERARLQIALALSTAVIEASSPEQQPVARLDLALCDVSTAPKEPAIGHPLEFLARQYGLRVDAFLASLTPVLDDCGQPDATAPADRPVSLAHPGEDLSCAGQPPPGRGRSRAHGRRLGLGQDCPDRHRSLAVGMAVHRLSRR